MRVLYVTNLTLNHLLSLLHGMETGCQAKIQIDEGGTDFLTLTVTKPVVETAQKALKAFSDNKFSIVITTDSKAGNCPTLNDPPDITTENWAAMSMNDRGSLILKEIRRQCDWSVDSAARHIGVTPSGWVYVEQGKRNIGLRFASKIRDGLTLPAKFDSMLRDATTNR